MSVLVLFWYRAFQVLGLHSPTVDGGVDAERLADLVDDSEFQEAYGPYG